MRQHILYEDKDIIVCHKPAGIATQTARVGQQDMVSEIKAYLSSQKKRNLSGQGAADISSYVGIVHRLDQPVEGILVFARNKAAAAVLSRQMTEGRMEKDYYAVVCGQDIPAGGELVNYLLKDGRTNLSKAVSKETAGAKEARLRFRTLECKQAEAADGCPYYIALVKIRLQTGRHHQIRVQMSEAGLGLLGDRKYADKTANRISQQMGIKDIALCAGRLALIHPTTGKKKVFSIMPEGKGFAYFRQEIETDREENA